MLPLPPALFPSARLMPGRGATLRGHGDRRTVDGVLTVGANGVITLQRAGKSGLLPSLVNAEAPVQLRAGPGMRIHGYGGIHTLERLPVPVIEGVPGPARLAWEVEQSYGRLLVCTLGYESSETPGNWVVATETTYEGTLGSYTETTAASGVVTAYGPNDPTPDACEAPTFESTFDPMVDYGDPVGSSTEETLVSVASLVASALAAVDIWQTTTGSQEWVRSVWQDVSEEVTPFTYSLGLPISIGYGVGATVEADNLRFRLRNRGSAALRVDCGFYGSGISGGATDIATVLDLAPGATSAWQEVPSIDPDPAKYYTAEIRRVRIGRFRTIP